MRASEEKERDAGDSLYILQINYPTDLRHALAHSYFDVRRLIRLSSSLARGRKGVAFRLQTLHGHNTGLKVLPEERVFFARVL